MAIMMMIKLILGISPGERRLYGASVGLAAVGHRQRRSAPKAAVEMLTSVSSLLFLTVLHSSSESFRVLWSSSEFFRVLRLHASSFCHSVSIRQKVGSSQQRGWRIRFLGPRRGQALKIALKGGNSAAKPQNLRNLEKKGAVVRRFY